MSISIPRPDDWHLHLRDGDFLPLTVAHSAAQFGRAIVMPNLKPPVTTVELAKAYRKRILAAVPAGSNFIPLMTLYLTDNTPPEEIYRAANDPNIYAVKLYPSGATTNSDSGVTDVGKVGATLAAMAETGLPLLVHAEVTDASIDLFDREKVFLDTILKPTVERYPDLKVVMEHVTTADGVRFVQQGGANIAGTITAHHLLYNRNALFQGGLRPHYYCLPVLKRESHREALLAAATADDGKFFLGTDSAPHPKDDKESACGCAGCYTAPIALQLYAKAFASVDKLDSLAAFASTNGPGFYGLPINTEQITLTEGSTVVPENYRIGERYIVPLDAGQSLGWAVSA